MQRCDAKACGGGGVRGGDPPRDAKKGGERVTNLRDLSCRLRCSLLLKARLQNWHLYFFSGANAELADDDFLIAAVVGMTLATGIFYDVCGLCVVRARDLEILMLLRLRAAVLCLDFLSAASSSFTDRWLKSSAFRERGRGV